MLRKLALRQKKKKKTKWFSYQKNVYIIQDYLANVNKH